MAQPLVEVGRMGDNQKHHLVVMEAVEEGAMEWQGHQVAPLQLMEEMV